MWIYTVKSKYWQCIFHAYIVSYTFILSDECQDRHKLNVEPETVIYNIPSIQLCIAICMMKEDYICNSIDILIVSGDCHLYKENKYTSPDKYIGDSNGLWEHCTVGNIWESVKSWHTIYNDGIFSGVYIGGNFTYSDTIFFNDIRTFKR